MSGEHDDLIEDETRLQGEQKFRELARCGAPEVAWLLHDTPMPSKKKW